MSTEQIIYAILTKNSLIVKLNACGKNYLHKAARCKSTIRLIRHMIILILRLAHRYVKALHELINKFESILESSCASNLKKHRKFIKLRIIGNVSKMILACVVLVGSKSKIYSKSLTLNIKSCALNSTLSKGFIIPTCSRLNSLIRQELIFNSGVVILNIRRALNES